MTSRTSGIGERAGEISWGREKQVRLLTLSARHSPLFVTSLHIATIKMKESDQLRRIKRINLLPFYPQIPIISFETARVPSEIARNVQKRGPFSYYGTMVVCISI